MSVSSVGAAAPASSNASNSLTNTDSSNAVQNFLNYMKETPAQRMEDNWLHAHGLTRQQLAAMPPDQQKAVMRQMEQDIERQLKQEAENGGKSKAMIQT